MRSHDFAMAVDSSYFLPVVDAPLHVLLRHTPQERAYRKWLTLLPVLVISVIAVGLVLWGVFFAVDFTLNSMADVRSNL
jgi:hypothetical protein